jgi:hypothetical protein
VTPKNNKRIVLCACTIALVLGSGKLRGAEGSETERQLRELQQQNRALQEQLRQQQSLIESLARKVSDIQTAEAQRSHEQDQH